LTEWMANGGCWLGVGGLCGMGGLIGAEARRPPVELWGGPLPLLGEGYLRPVDSEHPVLAGLRKPLHYFGGLAVSAAGAAVLAESLDAHGQPTKAPLLLE